MTANGKTFFLGLGAQKAGTSWLYNYLSSAPGADFGPLKEYHVWDALALPSMDHFDVRGHRVINRALMRATSTLKRSSSDGWKLRGHLQSDPENYFAHFEKLLDAPGIQLTGDITPAYAGLEPDALKTIKDGFEQRGITVKVGFIMRDPVSRAISAAKMNRRKRDWREGVPIFGDFDKSVLTYAGSKAHALRADYPRVIKMIKDIFSSDDTYFGIYENMFDLDILESMSAFLDVPYRPEQVNARVYSSASQSGASAEAKAALHQVLEGTYRYCAQAFPDTVALWQSSDRSTQG